MKITCLFLALSVVLAPLVHADEASHRKAAENVVIATDFSTTMRTGFLASFAAKLDGMKQRGMPDAAITEMRAALTKWFDTEVKPEEIVQKVIDLYVTQFTEAELNELLAFYKSPVGKKSIAALPNIMQQAAVIAQQYAQTKQASLNSAISPIVEKYRPQASKP